MFGYIVTSVAALVPLISPPAAHTAVHASPKAPPAGGTLAAATGANSLPTGDDLQRTETLTPWTVPNNALGVVLAKPFLNGRVTSLFGARRDPILGEVKFHRGLDIGQPLGTPVRASAVGVVRFAGLAHGYGKLIAITHRGELETRYGHLSTLLVRTGAEVVEGQVIGLTGSTGRSTGPHLHWEVRVAGRAIDPQHPLALVPPPTRLERGEVAPRWTGWSMRSDILPAAY